ncbi:MAG TPA: sigma-54 dependent transcriptional regulator [Gemmatimonadales bacterium]
MATIVCVDDEPSVGAVLEHALVKLGHQPLPAGSAEEALRLIRDTRVDLVITDYQMPGMTGMDLLRVIGEEGYAIPVIMMTGYSSIDHAVTSIRSGAVDYITKPVGAERLELAVDHALEFARLRRENEAFRAELNTLKVGRTIVGQSAPLRRALETIRTVAPTRATVLIEGESGTGKELFARAIHDLSRRSAGPFVTVNCAAMPEGLIESVLFGHEKGAFTGATGRVQGAFERAHVGTLLLDEVSEMRLDLQAKLLRAIQEQEFERVGGHEPVRVDVRFIATTNRDLAAEVEGGRFRGDLYYRLSVVPLRAPTLRERPEDIPLLVRHFLRQGAVQLGVPVPPVASETLALLQSHPWPGNVRELANAVERALILSGGGPLTPEAFATLRSERLPAGSDAQQLDLAELERRAIARALEATGGNRARAAMLLGISDRTLRNKLKQRA